MQCERKVLSNGMRVLVVPMQSNPTVTVLVLVEAGSKYETKKNNGVSHFLEHMCFKGTTNRPNASDLAIELDGLGCEFNAFTGQEYTGYHVKSKSGNFSQVLDIIADLYLNPLFKAEEIEKEKGVIVEEINMNGDEPMRKIRSVWTGLLYGDQPAGWTVLGEQDVVRGMTREDFIAYRANHYVASATTVVVAGNVDPAQVFKAVAEKFGKIQNGKKGTKLATLVQQSEPNVAISYKETCQTHLRLGVRSFAIEEIANDEIIEVLAGILGYGISSRLFRKIRDEMGVGYYVSAGNSPLTDHGHFLVAAGVANERVDEVIRAILAEFRKMKDDLVGEKELIKVKEHMVGTMYLGLETSDSFAVHYGGQEVHHCQLRTPEEDEALIRAVTAEEVREMARRIFVKKNLNLALVGPFTDSDALKKLLKF